MNGARKILAMAALGTLPLLLPALAFAQFVETDCPLKHPNYPKSELIVVVPLEDGEMSHYLPDFSYKEKDGSEIGIIDYRFLDDMKNRHAKLLCKYVGAPPLRLDIHGLLTRCTFHTRELKRGYKYLRGFCESDISPAPETGKQ